MRFKRKEKEVSPMEKALKEQKPKEEQEIDDLYEESSYIYDINDGFVVDHDALPNKQADEDDVVNEISYKKITDTLEDNKDLVTELVKSKRADKYQKDNFYKFNSILTELYEDFDMIEIITELVKLFELNVDETIVVTSFMLESHRHILREEMEYKFNVSNQREIGLLRFF